MARTGGHTRCAFLPYPSPVTADLRSIALLLLLGAAACEDEGAELLVGRWERNDGFEEITFEADGRQRTRMDMPGNPRNLAGRYKLDPAAGRWQHRRLQVCNDGDECEGGGLWTTYYVQNVNREELILLLEDDPASSTREVFRRRR